jgi:VanZ family protein
VGWASLILIATSIPIPGALATASPAGADKLVHATMYAVLAWLTARGAATPSVRAAIVVFASVGAFGAVDEWHQRFIPGRTPTPADLVADIVGAGFGVLAFQSAHRRRESLS